MSQDQLHNVHWRSSYPTSEWQWPALRISWNPFFPARDGHYPETAELQFTQPTAVVCDENDFDWARPKITDERTKCSYMVKALDNATANRVRDILMKPLTSEPYMCLKGCVLGFFKLTPRERVSWVLGYPALGDLSSTCMIDEFMGQPCCLATFSFTTIPITSVLSWGRMSLTTSMTSQGGWIRLRNISADIAAAQLLDATQVAPRRATTTNKKKSQEGRKQQERPKGCVFHRKFGPTARNCQLLCSFKIPGKQRGRATVAAVFPDLSQNLFSYMDKSIGVSFLIIRGDAIMVFPVTFVEVSSLSQDSSLLLLACNGMPAQSYWKKQLSLTIRTTSFQWLFLLAKVSHPMLSAYFLRPSGFLVDVCNKWLVKADKWDADTYTSGYPRRCLHGVHPAIRVWGLAPLLLPPSCSDRRFPNPLFSMGSNYRSPKKGRPVFARARQLTGP